MARLWAFRRISDATPVILLFVALLLASIQHHPDFSPSERHVIGTGIYSLASAVLAHSACHLFLWSIAAEGTRYAPVYCMASTVGTAAAVAMAYTHISEGFGLEEWTLIEYLPNRKRHSMSNRLVQLLGSDWTQRGDLNLNL